MSATNGLLGLLIAAVLLLSVAVLYLFATRQTGETGEAGVRGPEGQRGGRGPMGPSGRDAE